MTRAGSPGQPETADIFHVNQDELEWQEYSASIHYKALTARATAVPPVQFIEYGPGETDPVHHHDVGELFIVTSGEMWIDDRMIGPNGVVFVPACADYAVRAGDEGVRYFRVVTG